MKYITTALSIVLLFLGFGLNLWKTVEPQWFESFQRDSEALVVGRLINSQVNGVMSDNMFLGGWTRANNAESSPEDQYNIFLGKTEKGDYSEYESQIGLQGFFFSLIEKLLPVGNDYMLMYLKGINVLILSVLLTGLVIWCFNEFNLITSWVLLIGIICSQWLIIFGRNLYWVAWSMYLPFFICLFILFLEEKKQKRYKRTLNLLIFLAVFIKCGSGYEYISSVFITAIVPLIYYAYKSKWAPKVFVLRVISVSLSSLIGFLSALFIHIYLLYLKYSSLSDALSVIKLIILKRTYGDANEVPAVFRESLNANVFEVVSTYLNGFAFDLNNFFGTHLDLLKVSFKDMIWFFLVITSLVFVSEKISTKIQLHRRKLIGLTLSLWFSLLAPLSWFIMAKGHSYIHTHINYFLWQLPFTLVGFALTGSIISYLLSDLLQKKRKTKILLLFFGLGIMIIFLVKPLIGVYRSDLAFNQLIQQSEMKVNTLNYKIYVNYSEGKLIYISNKKSANLDEKFFLHIYPLLKNKVLDEQRISYGYDNFDFFAADYQKKSPYFSRYSKEKIFIKELPKYAIQQIDTGEFNESGQLWSRSIIYDISKIRPNYINIANLTDENWKNGVNRTDSNVILIDNNYLNQIYLYYEKKLKINSNYYKIESYNITNDKWIILKLDNKV
ncbi:hypothetical protein ACE3NQ_26140 [Paenibacillus terreus]|uniref:Glycosyltransferase RgtA/B/C/D-like domain-containing protein n=1 Tax=Paenibacillus terreus TaxID=1387834 RepID=A0ABV5BFA6_9BACL